MYKSRLNGYTKTTNGANLNILSQKKTFKSPLITNEIDFPGIVNTQESAFEFSQKVSQTEKSEKLSDEESIERNNNTAANCFDENEIQVKNDKRKDKKSKRDDKTYKAKENKCNNHRNEVKNEVVNGKSFDENEFSMNQNEQSRVPNGGHQKKKVIKSTHRVSEEVLNNQRSKDDEDEVDSAILSLWSQTDVPPPSDPPSHYSHYEKLVWLQERRAVGIYVQCDWCDKYRYLMDVHDPLELPDKWYCVMNPDKNYNSCKVPQQKIPAYEELDMIHNLYNAGSIVWAKVAGYPWWPAMVDDDPDIEQYFWLDEYSDVPTWYHVVFFDTEKVTRAWLKPDAIHKYKDYEDGPQFGTGLCYSKFWKRLDCAKVQAGNALNMSVAERLKTYSFISRWPYPIKEPTKSEDVQNGNKKTKPKNRSSTKRSYKKCKTKSSGSDKAFGKKKSKLPRILSSNSSLNSDIIEEVLTKYLEEHQSGTSFV